MCFWNWRKRDGDLLALSLFVDFLFDLTQAVHLVSVDADQGRMVGGLEINPVKSKYVNYASIRE